MATSPAEQTLKIGGSEKDLSIERSNNVSAGTVIEIPPWNAPRVLRLNAYIASCVLLGSYTGRRASFSHYFNQYRMN